jgi:hypothetical protein
VPSCPRSVHSGSARAHRMPVSSTPRLQNVRHVLP